MTDSVKDNSESPPVSEKPRPGLLKRLFKWGSLIFVLWFLVTWFLGPPRVLSGHRVITKNGEGRFDLEFINSWLSTLFPSISFGKFNVEYDLTSVESIGNHSSHYLANRHLWIINRSDSLLTRRLATQLIEKFNERQLLEEIEYFPADQLPEAGFSEPDYYLEMELLKVEAGVESNDPELLIDLAFRYSNKLAKTPELGDQNYPRDLCDMDDRFIVQIKIQNSAWESAGAKHATLVRELVEEIDRHLNQTASLSYVESLEGRSGPLPDHYYPAFQPAPQFDFLNRFKAEQQQACSGYLKPNETLWNMTIDSRKYSEFLQKVKNNLAEQGWEEESVPIGLRMKLGHDLIQVMPWNENYRNEDFLTGSKPFFEKKESILHNCLEQNTHTIAERKFFRLEITPEIILKNRPLGFLESRTAGEGTEYGKLRNHSSGDRNEKYGFFRGGSGESFGGHEPEEEDLLRLKKMFKKMPEIFSPHPVKATGNTNTQTLIIQYLNLLEPEEIQQILDTRLTEKAPFKELYFHQPYLTEEQSKVFLTQIDQAEKQTVEDWLVYAQIRSEEKWFNAEIAQDAAKRAYYLSFTYPDHKDQFSYEASEAFEKAGGGEHSLEEGLDKKVLEELGIPVYDADQFPATLKLKLGEYKAFVTLNEVGEIEFNIWRISEGKGFRNKYQFQHWEFSGSSTSSSGHPVKSLPFKDGQSVSSAGGNSKWRYSYHQKSSYIVDKTDDPMEFTLTYNRNVIVDKKEPWLTEE